jgi:N-acetylneuraminate synthase/sialic acid synthase
MTEIIVDKVRIGGDAQCYVIAEIGHNHQGSVEKAMDLIRVAKECGADAVKLQKRNNRTLFTRAMYAMPYDNPNSFGATYGEHREALELDKAQYRDLIAYAKELEITLFATPFDFDSADFLAELDMPAYKIASGDLLNTPLQRHVAQLGRPMFLSTGGGTLDDVRRAYHTIMPINPQLCVMQCTASYPAQVEDLNLRVIERYRKQFPDAVVGLSDHQNGIVMAVVAYLLGARAIEKHFTLDHTWKGTDHAFSLQPDGLRKLVRDLRRVPLALGSADKEPLDIEVKPLTKMGKKLVAAHPLAAGATLGAGDIAIRSPGEGGLPPYELDRLVGKVLRRALDTDDELSFDLVD